MRLLVIIINQLTYRRIECTRIIYLIQELQISFIIIVILMSTQDKATELKNLGNQAFKNKNYDEAIKYFTQAIQINPNDQVFFSNRSGSYLNAAKYAQALHDAEMCIKLKSDWSRGYQRKGTALFYMNRLDQAIKAYEQGLKFDAQNQQLKSDLKAAQDKQLGAQQGMLQAYLKLAQHPETKQYISDPQFMQKIQALIQNPALFQLFQNDPKIKKAYEVISQGGMPNNFDFQQFMKNMEKQEPKFRAKNQPKKQEKQQKMEDQAASPKKQKTQQKKQEPKKQEPKQLDLAQQAKNQGNNEYKKKNFQKALELYQKAIDLKGSQPLYYNNKAAAYIQLGKYEEAHKQLALAEKIFEDGLKDYIKKGKILARKASLLAKQGKFDQSIQIYQKSLLQDGVQKVRDELKAVQKIKKQKQDKQYLNPELAEKACEAGNALFKQGKFPAALKQYEQAIKRNPNSAKYYSNLGTVYIKLMEWPRAKDNFEIALKKDPSYIKAYPKKGDCHFALKQFHKALQTYEAGLKIDPQNQLCKTGIVKTQQAIYTSSGSGGNEEQKMQRAKRAMADPQIQQILNTPQVRNALQDLRTNPGAINHIMSNPSLAAKIEKLVQAGVVGMG